MCGLGHFHRLGSMYSTLREFVAGLESHGELSRERGPVSPILDITRRADAESKTAAPNMPSASARACDPRFAHLGGRALLFEHVEGSQWPVLINAWGSYRRMEMALGCPQGFAQIAEKIAALVKPEPPRTAAELFAFLKRVAPLLKIPPKRRKGMGLCQEVVIPQERVDLTRLPIIRCWPLDGDFASLGYPANVNDHVPGLGRGPEWDAKHRGRYITLAGIHTIHASDRDHPAPPSHNIGMYRVQLLGERTLAMHWHMHHDGARHWRSWKALGKPMPVAIALGGESVMPYAATAPLPPGISELLLAGFLHGKGIPLVRARTVPLWVPANAEIIIEGYVSHEAGLIGFDPRGISDPPAALGPGAVFEGPFGDHTGFYSMPDRYPTLQVTAITHRRDPIYPTTVVGLPPQEDYFLGKATERIMLPLLKTILPDIEDYDLPLFGAFHNAAFIKIKKHYPMHARRLAHGVWGAGQMSWTKAVVVVDDDVDVHDTTAVLRAIGEHCVPGRDIEAARGPLDILDHAAPFLGAGGKMGLDATRKLGDAEQATWPGVWGPDAASGWPGGPRRSSESCDAPLTPINAVLGPAAVATLARVRTIPGVLDASIPESLGGWWLFIRAGKSNPGDGAAIIKALGALPNEVELPRWTIVVGPDADVANIDDALFHWLAHSCPARDRYDSRCGRRIAFDATPKLPGDERFGLPVRAWPPILKM
ncbi:MAG: hypothetical protein GC200_04590 [Tepidisphaera sp.]|nr:hypothetical protein [Tepidisphaera sp.]